MGHSLFSSSRSALAAIALLLVGCATAPAPRLEGQEWQLIAWSLSSERASDFTITARFADGGVSGRSAVNNYRAPVTLGPDHTLAVGPMAMTRMAGPEPALRAEKAYLELLGDARSWQIEDGRLRMLDAGGNESLVFASTAD
jgi:heat shock protein HslJ